jgi:hypothetical protein
MVLTEHTHKAFDADLQELSRMIAEMGGLAERKIFGAMARACGLAHMRDVKAPVSNVMVFDKPVAG